MIRLGIAYRLCGLLLLLLWGAKPVPAQFVDLTLNVEPELSAHTERLLDFGELETNSGKEAVNLGDSKMGIFSIQALEHQLLHISLEIPAKLEHVEEEVDENVPLNLQARLGYNPNNPENSLPLQEGSTDLAIRPTAQPGPISTLYLYIYGSLFIDDIPEGYYENHIVLDIEYL